MKYEHWRGRLAEANDPLFWPITAFDEMLVEGLAQLWATDKAALITKINEYPGGAVAVEVLAAAGEGDELRGPIAEAVEAGGRSIGATHIRIEGRRGWGRTLKASGWKIHQEILLKDIA